MDGTQIPLGEMAEIRFVRGPQMIRSEDTFLTAYITFGPLPGHAEVEVVEQVRDFLRARIDAGELMVPQGVSWRFAGNYEHQLRAARTLAIVLPVSLLLIFLILFFQFRSVATTLIVFSGIAVAWAGGFVMIYFYGQEWFANFDIFGVNMRAALPAARHQSQRCGLGGISGVVRHRHRRRRGDRHLSQAEL
jgi:copper/silver efflux system protein